MKMPKSITPEIFSKVCERVASGMTVRAVCRMEGMPDRTDVYKAIAISEDYHGQYMRAREAQMIMWEEEIIEIASDSSEDMREDGRINHEHIQRSRLRTDVMRWIMSKRLPKLYGDRAVREISGPDGGPIKTQASNIDLSKLSDEELEALEKVQEKLKS